jgi:uncharacterized membrane protein
MAVIDWAVEHIDSGNPFVTVIVLLAAVAAAHAGNALTGLLMNKWSERKI